MNAERRFASDCNNINFSYRIWYSLCWWCLLSYSRGYSPRYQFASLPDGPMWLQCQPEDSAVPGHRQGWSVVVRYENPLYRGQFLVPECQYAVFALGLRLLSISLSPSLCRMWTPTIGILRMGSWRSVISSSLHQYFRARNRTIGRILPILADRRSGNLLRECRLEYRRKFPHQHMFGNTPVERIEWRAFFRFRWQRSDTHSIRFLAGSANPADCVVLRLMLYKNELVKRV